VKRQLAAVLLLVVACSEPTIPARTSTYAFKLGFSDDVFRWPSNRLPVRYYADTRSNMRELVANAVGAWENQLLYGEFTGELVSDSTQADVIITWGDSIPPDVPPDPGAPVFACDGKMTLVFDSAGTALTEPIRTQIRIPTAQVYTPAQVSACLRRVTIHELGHTLGLLQESGNVLDVMYTAVEVTTPSGRDRQTVQVLYHTPPTIAPPPR
jgi:predicted Zn-dependent protease